MNAKDEALLALGRELQRDGYRFTTITPASHHRVNSRPTSTATPLQRIFGWSLPFRAAELQPDLLALLEQAGELDDEENSLRSKVRFSTLGEQIFVHSAFPTDASDTVFFGPDTYRFARALRHAIADYQAPSGLTIVDVGCGSGAGGLYAAAVVGPATNASIILSDINPKALRFSEINAQLNNVPNVTTVESSLFDKIDEQANLIISNPPYLVDPSARLYRHGGGELGFDLSLRIVEEALPHLRPGGRLFLYTGTAVVNGVDWFFEALRPRLEANVIRYTYEEIDPDVFGEELENPPYDCVDRIAVVALTVFV
jgi:methylase of polypeptide subunit release factors